MADRDEVGEVGRDDDNENVALGLHEIRGKVAVELS